MAVPIVEEFIELAEIDTVSRCLLYTSDAADEL